jgi:hypothetical protein
MGLLEDIGDVGGIIGNYWVIIIIVGIIILFIAGVYFLWGFIEVNFFLSKKDLAWQLINNTINNTNITN